MSLQPLMLDICPRSLKQIGKKCSKSDVCAAELCSVERVQPVLRLVANSLYPKQLQKNDIGVMDVLSRTSTEYGNFVCTCMQIQTPRSKVKFD